jgi:hypothetical protein
MAWNLELLCIEQPEMIPMEFLVPESFEPTGQVMSFDQMLKVLKTGDLYVAQTGRWSLIFDGQFGLSSDGDYLESVSADGDAYMTRLTQSPLLYHYHQGLLQTEHIGIRGCLQALDRDKLQTPKVVPHGESLAMEMIQRQTDLRFPQSFQDLEYHGFRSIQAA